MVESELAANTYLCKIAPQLLLSSLPPVICTQKTWNQPAPKMSKMSKFELKAADDSVELIPNSISSRSATDFQSSGQTCIKKRLSKESFSGCDMKYINIAKIAKLPPLRPGIPRIPCIPGLSCLVCPGLSWPDLVCPGLTRSVLVCPGGLVKQRTLKVICLDPEGYIFGRL